MRGRLSLLGRISGHVGRIVLGLSILGWVVDQCGLVSGEVVVHVVEAEVEVIIGGQHFQVHEPCGRPIVCDLPAGSHELVMKRGETVLSRESFELHGGESRVLTAWAPGRGWRRGGAGAELDKS